MSDVGSNRFGLNRGVGRGLSDVLRRADETDRLAKDADSRIFRDAAGGPYISSIGVDAGPGAPYISNAGPSVPYIGSDDEPDEPKSDGAAQVELEAAVQAGVDTEVTKTFAARGQRRADALWAVWRAKAQDGRSDKPPTAHDADTAWLIADLLHQVAGHGDQVRAPSAAASNGAASGRMVGPDVEAAIMKSAVANEGEARS